jgi:two-component system, LytTR family, sensor kinase
VPERSILGRVSTDAAGRPALPAWVLICAAWSIPAVLAAFEQYMQGRISGEPPSWRWIVFNSVDWFLYALLTPAVLRAGRRLPLRRPHLARNIGFHIIGALALCVIWAGLGTLLRLAIFPIPTAVEALQGFASWTLTTLPFGVSVYFAIVGIEHALFYFAEARDREMQAIRLEAQLAEARLGALRMQLNPHFLFNSLNAITVLVRDRDTAAATRMLELLSDVLREALRSDAGHETQLQKELAFVERYLAIEQIRFSDRLRVRVDAEPAALDAVVPTFVLQPLVENALRHGIARKAAAGALEIAARIQGTQLVLTVQDDGPGLERDQPERPGGVGLENLRARLAALYGERASLTIANAEPAGAVATVRLPYRTMQPDPQRDEQDSRPRR